jgi:UDP-GlcNAc:undecaprenyl-phosphate/decaprenyl-phosphate GlcNAc-1-phosphate transferase
VREYLLTLVVAAAVTYLMTPVARRLALRWGAMTEVRDRDVHAIPTPRLGGVAMLAGFAASLLVALHLPFLGPTFGQGPDVRAMLTCAVLIVLLGVADDKWELDAITKLAGQVLVAGVLVLQGVQMLYLPVGGIGGASDGSPGAFVLGRAEGTVLTVLIVVATINAVNFVDGLDGLATGVVAIGAVAFFFFCYQLTSLNNAPLASTGALLSAMLGGACVGFLPHNVNPARLFMGDSGSMLIGLVLSSSAITLTGQYSGTELTKGAMGSPASLAPTFLPLALPITLLVVPIADLVLAVIRRTRAGRSPMSPDKQHLHHRLLEIGHSQRRAVLIMWMWAALVAGSTVVISLYTGPLMWTGIGAAAFVTVVLTFLLPTLRRPGRAAPETP